MPRYFVEAVKRFREQLKTFIDQNFNEVKIKMQADANLLKISFKKTLNDENFLLFKQSWVENMVIARKHGHYDLANFYLYSRAYVLDRAPPL